MNIYGKSASALFYKLINTAVSFIIGIIIARTLMPDGRGIYAFITATSVLIATLGSLGMGNASIYLINNEKYDLKKTYNTLFWFSIVVSIVLIIFTKLSFYLAPRLYNNLNSEYVNNICFLILLNMINSFINPILLTNLNITRMNIVNITTTILQLVLIIIGWYLNIVTVNYCIDIYIIVLLANVIMIVVMEKMYYIFKFNIDKNILKNTFFYGIKVYVGNVAYLLHLQFDTYLINYFCTSNEVGIYSIAVSLAQLLFFVPNTIGPLFYSYWSKSSEPDSKEIIRAIRGLFYSLSIISLFLLLIGKIFIAKIYGIQYSNAYIPLVILLPGIVFMSFNYIFFNYYSAIGKPQVSSIITIICVIINTIINIILIPIYKSTGAALASLISYTISSVLTMYIFNKSLRLNCKELIFQILDFNNFIKDSVLLIRTIKNRI